MEYGREVQGANAAIKAGNEAMEYANRSKKSIIAPGLYYNIIADSYADEKAYEFLMIHVLTNYIFMFLSVCLGKWKN